MISPEVKAEILKQVRHATKRPCKRVFIGKYNGEDGQYNVYVSVEKIDGKRKAN